MRARLRKKLSQQAERLRAYYEACGIPYYIEESSVFKKKHMNYILHRATDRWFKPEVAVIQTKLSNNAWFEAYRKMQANAVQEAG